MTCCCTPTAMCVFMPLGLHDRVSSTGNNSPKLTSGHHAFVFADVVPLLSNIFPDHINPHFHYFLHSLTASAANASGFLQVSLSKILADRHPASTSTWLASDFRSTLTTSRAQFHGQCYYPAYATGLHMSYPAVRERFRG